ncbi:MAG: single-stranded DNA-binding protein [Tenacibaculum sp.]
MNSLKNKVQLIGYLGNNPEITTFESGKKVAKFSLATNESYKNTLGQKVKDTQWHNIVVWNKTASFAEQFLQKGVELMVEGRLTYRSFEDKKGQKRYITEIICHELFMLRNKNQVQEVL